LLEKWNAMLERLEPWQIETLRAIYDQHDRATLFAVEER
jgi:hypothetical protein